MNRLIYSIFSWPFAIGEFCCGSLHRNVLKVLIRPKDWIAGIVLLNRASPAIWVMGMSGSIHLRLHLPTTVGVMVGVLAGQACFRAADRPRTEPLRRLGRSRRPACCRRTSASPPKQTHWSCFYRLPPFALPSAHCPICECPCRPPRSRPTDHPACRQSTQPACKRRPAANRAGACTPGRPGRPWRRLGYRRAAGFGEPGRGLRLTVSQSRRRASVAALSGDIISTSDQLWPVPLHPSIPSGSLSPMVSAILVVLTDPAILVIPTFASPGVIPGQAGRNPRGMEHSDVLAG